VGADGEEFGPDDLVGLRNLHHVLPVHRHTPYSWLHKNQLPPPDGTVSMSRPRSGWKVSTIRAWYCKTHGLEDEELPPTQLPDDQMLGLKDFHLVVPVHERTPYEAFRRSILPMPDGSIADDGLEDAWKVSTIQAWFDRRQASSSRRWRRDVVAAAVANRVCLDDNSTAGELAAGIMPLVEAPAARIDGAVAGTSELIVRVVFPA
jgi:predicted DNA-binding transcriptional regulator AlpA